MPDDLLTTTEAGDLLSVTGETIRRWVELGRIAYIELPSGQVRIRRSDVDAILAPKVGEAS